MIHFLKSWEVQRMLEMAAFHSMHVSPAAGQDMQEHYGGAMDSYWWNLAAEERKQFTPLEIPDSWEYFPEEPLGPDVYVPVEFGLAVCVALIEDAGYVSQRQALREGLAPTSEQASDAFWSLYTGDDPFNLKPRLEQLKVGREQLKKSANWWLDMTIRSEGASEFTRRARETLTTGKPDFQVFSFIAYKTLLEQSESERMKIPRQPLNMPAGSTSDLPGIWQVRKMKTIHPHFGTKVFYICANEVNQGVCFSVAPEKHLELDLKLGDLVTLRAGIVGLHESKRYLALERVQVKRPQSLEEAA